MTLGPPTADGGCSRASDSGTHYDCGDISFLVRQINHSSAGGGGESSGADCQNREVKNCISAVCPGRAAAHQSYAEIGSRLPPAVGPRSPRAFAYRTYSPHKKNKQAHMHHMYRIQLRFELKRKLCIQRAAFEARALCRRHIISARRPGARDGSAHLRGNTSKQMERRDWNARLPRALTPMWQR
ncbi:hypothetical protein EVAR_56560_1 [Eumeta japonica]|uniref:Uncharacterized protein n=1 Tax=Eumeta variegata TaxID=151549 RepID=A0A4C1ZRA8_EUMVA|nr:hypothetical protein EVAR_56560_1 [Eumeta japonica]